MSLTPEWTEDVRGDATKLQYHATPGLLAVGIDEGSPSGSGVAFLQASDGSRMGTLGTTGSLQRTEYDERAEMVFAITDEDYVYAIDPETAELRWETQASGVGAATEETVFVHGANTVRAHGVDDGSREWKTVLPDSVYGGFFLVGDTLFAGIGEWKDEGVVAVDPETGQKRWHYRPGSAKSLDVSEDGIYTKFESEKRETELVHLNGTTGVEQWSYDVGTAGFWFHPDDGTVYIEGSERVISLNDVTGRESWRSDEYYDVEDLDVDDENVYATVEVDSLEYQFVKMDANTGRAAWETWIDNDKWSIDVGDSDIFLGTYASGFSDNGGTLYRLNATTGRLSWEFSIDESVDNIAGDSDPVLALGDNTVYAVERDSGRAVWSFADDSLYLESATDRRVVLNGDGSDYVLDRETGDVEGTVDSTNGPVWAADGALFTADGSVVTAYPVAERPEAFDHDATEKPGSNTKVYGGKSGVAGETGVYDESGNSESDGDPDAGSDTAKGDGAAESTVSFCPNCGADIGAFGDVNFCPECGEDLSP